jgi:hypothetical protein
LLQRKRRYGRRAHAAPGRAKARRRLGVADARVLIGAVLRHDPGSAGLGLGGERAGKGCRGGQKSEFAQAFILL